MIQAKIQPKEITMALKYVKQTYSLKMSLEERSEGKIGDDSLYEHEAKKRVNALHLP